MKKPKETMTGAMLTPKYRERLARIIEHYKRSFRAQLEAWIDTELRIIERD